MKQEDIIRMAESHLKSADAELKKFAGEVLENPLHAMRWAGSAFSNAGQKVAWNYILDAAQGGVTVEGLIDELSTIVVRGAKSSPASSNGCANMLQLEETAAYAGALEYFRRVHRLAQAQTGRHAQHGEASPTGGAKG